MFQDAVFLCCCFLAAAVSEEEKVLPPENLTLGWLKGLYQELSWTPPGHSLQGCYYTITSNNERGCDYCTRSQNETSSSWSEFRALQGGFLHLTIQTVCSGRESEAKHIIVDDPDFQLSCFIVSSTVTRCSWKPPDSAQLSLFYNVERSGKFGELRECSRYNGARTSCDLQVEDDPPMNVLLNGTLGNRTVRNVHFFQDLICRRRLPALNWSVVESKDRFLISWTGPGFERYNWKYRVYYTACNVTSFHETSNLSAVLIRDAKCPYRISLRALLADSECTEPTPEELYDAESELEPLLFAAVLTPLLLAAIVVLTSLWCKKNKSKIFPKVPRPNSELFTDLTNNNKMIHESSCYFPKVEEECEVTLVSDLNQAPL